MPQLHNHTDQTITTPSGFTIPAGGSLRITEETWARMQREPYTMSKVRRGHLECLPDKPAKKPAKKGAKAEPLTRETVAMMGEADLADTLRAHGVTDEDLADQSLDQMRDAAGRVIFADL